MSSIVISCVHIAATSAAATRTAPYNSMRSCCVRPVCPWCLLGAQHGNLIDVRARERELLADLRARSAPMHARFTIVNAAVWCHELCGIQTFTGSSTIVEPCITGDVAEAPRRSAPYASPGPARGASSASSAPRSRFAPPPPPHKAASPVVAETPDVEHISDDDAGDQRAVPGQRFSVWSGQPMAPAAAPPEPARRGLGDPEGRWQVWGGARTKWITYENEVQTILEAAWKRWEVVEVTIQGRAYTIDPRGMWQNCGSSDQPHRRVRWTTEWR